VDFILSLVFGFLIGLPMGGLGGGGGVMLFPLLVYGLGLPPKIAVAHSIVIVGVTCLFAFALYCKDGAVRVKEAAILATLGACGAQLGAYATSLVSEREILFAACVLLFSVAYIMWRSSTTIPKEYALEHGKIWVFIPIGAFVGFVTGFLGVGGGFLLVPACIIIGRMSVKYAAGTSLLVGLINACSGHLAHQNINLNYSIIVPFLMASCLSSALARNWAKRVADSTLKKVFAMFLGLIASGMLVDATLYLL
jgi:hypothetical protein